jgi:predicted ATPase
MRKDEIVSDNTGRFFVITGGPGAGKTTLIDALQQAGYARSIEAGRGVIQEQMAIGGRALPWSDRMAFAESMLVWEMRSYRMAQEWSGSVFFDRGLPDVVGYLRVSGLPVPDYMDEAARSVRYNHRVFIAPPWKEIFAQDGERKQNFDEAVRTYDVMIATYAEYGYETIEIPRATVEERVCFMVNEVSIAG